LAATLWGGLTGEKASPERLHSICSAFNFGPNDDSNRTVSQLVDEILLTWPGAWIDLSDPAAVHEARLLSLSIEKAGKVLGWRPRWTFEESVRETVTWYRVVSERGRISEAGSLTRRQIAEYGSLRTANYSETPEAAKK
jgi:CDP-glucose 4,6-dehydratase